ncbi:MAG: hypothetical protein LBD30_02285 [Verrucomicrobiales bacterium]|nr:hypothetical protein [Verrucomicrobiales bacterium]
MIHETVGTITHSVLLRVRIINTARGKDTGFRGKSGKQRGGELQDC